MFIQTRKQEEGPECVIMARSHDTPKLLIRHRDRSNSLIRHFTRSRGNIKTISQQPEYYHGWPTLVRRKNGQLIVAYSAVGRITSVHSGVWKSYDLPDNGESWSWPESLWIRPSTIVTQGCARQPMERFSDHIYFARLSGDEEAIGGLAGR